MPRLRETISTRAKQKKLNKDDIPYAWLVVFFHYFTEKQNEEKISSPWYFFGLSIQMIFFERY